MIATGSPVGRPSRPDQLGRRYQAKVGARAEVRRLADMSVDLGAGLANLSEEGACVRVTVPMATGEKVELRLRRAGARRRLKVEAEIRWCRPLGGGLYIAGVRLARHLTPAEVADLAR
jgi:hypothetical protein